MMNVEVNAKCWNSEILAFSIYFNIQYSALFLLPARV